MALTCSFVVAMLLTPWLCRFFIRRGLKGEGDDATRKKFSVLDLMQRSYNVGIQLAMRQKTLTLAGGLATFVIAIVLLGKAVPERFFPTAERAQFVIHVWMKEGARLDATDEAARKIERFLKTQPLVANFSTFVGESAPRFYYNVDPEFPAKNYAQLLVNTRSAEATPKLVFELRRQLSEVAPEAFTMVRELEQGTRMHAPIEVRVISTADGPDDLVRLKTVAAQVRDILRSAPGAEYTYHDFHEDLFDMGVRVDEEVANRLGLSNQSIALQLSGGFSGLPVSTFWEGDARRARYRPAAGRRAPQQFRRSAQRCLSWSAQLTNARVPLRAVARSAGRSGRSSRIRAPQRRAHDDGAHGDWRARARCPRSRVEVAPCPKPLKRSRLPAGYQHGLRRRTRIASSRPLAEMKVALLHQHGGYLPDSAVPVPLACADPLIDDVLDSARPAGRRAGAC